MDILIQLFLLVAGFVMLIKGADFFVDGASKIADRFGIPQIVIGLTIVAMGTSLPEAAVSITAAAKGSAQITIGNVLGSNILNVLLILGITSVIRSIPVKKNTLKFEIPFVILITCLLAFLGLSDGVIDRKEGVVFWALFVLFLLYLYHLSKKGENVAEETVKSPKEERLWKLLLLVVFGAGMIVFGSDITVDAATEIARMFGWSERLIGLTIVAFGTSLPELVTSAVASLKGKADIAVGNIVGSNIFNILFVVGTTALIVPVVYAAGFFADSLVCIGAVILLLLCVVRGQRLGRAGGCALLVCYAAYFVYLVRG